MDRNSLCTAKGHNWTHEYLDGPGGEIYATYVCTRCGTETQNPRPPSGAGTPEPEQLELLHGTPTPVYRPEEATE